jgi:hypothetical protein
MAPEQAEGRVREVDARTDVYALGVILYETLAGRVPFTGDDMTALLREVIAGKPVPPPGPPALRAIALKAMRKDPAARYATAEAFAQDLANYLEGKPVEALASPPRTWRVRWLIGAALAAGLLLAVTLLLRKPAETGPLAEISPSDFQDLFRKLQPPDNEPWRTIPWRLSLVDAQNEAARERKPLFLWAMIGHPLSCAGPGALADRGSLFNDPEAVKILKTHFVPVALDEPNVRNRKDAAGEFFRKIAEQARPSTLPANVEGKYACSPDGKLLAHTNHYFPERLRQVLREALDRFVPSEAAALPTGPVDSSYEWKAPPQGVVASVTARVLGGYGPSDDPWTRILQESLARNRLWLWKDETDALARGDLPDTVRRRIARFCLVDITRGSSAAWEFEDVKHLELSLVGGRLTGSAHLETKSRDRGYVARILGFVDFREGRATRFDLVARGEYWTPSGGPAGRYPFAVAMTLAPKNAWIDAPPLGIRDLNDYTR